MKTIMPPIARADLDHARKGWRLFLFALSAKRNRKIPSAYFASLMSLANGRCI